MSKTLKALAKIFQSSKEKDKPKAKREPAPIHPVINKTETVQKRKSPVRKSIEKTPFITFDNYSKESIKISHIIEEILRDVPYPNTRSLRTFTPASGARFLMETRINSVLMLKSNIFEYFQLTRDEMDHDKGYHHYCINFDKDMNAILSIIEQKLLDTYPRYVGYTTVVGRGKPGSYYYVAKFQ